MKRIAIVGGGIAGLAAAHALKARRLSHEVEVLVLEKSDRPGGNIRTEMIDGFACEWGPNGFLDSVPETLELARALGLEKRLQPSDDAARKRFIFLGGRLHALPGGPWDFLTSGLLSWRGKARIGWEPFARSRPEGDETIHAFAARRIGREAADVLIDSMVSGIFAGEARRLSLRACFPKMWQMETDHGGLFRALFAMRKRKRSGEGLGAPAGKLTSFEGGMEELPRAAAAALGGSLRTGATVVAVRSMPGAAGTGIGAVPGLEVLSSTATGEGLAHGSGQPSAGGAGNEDRGSVDAMSSTARQSHRFAPHSRFVLELAGGDRIAADSVVLAGPSADSARLVSDLDAALAAALREIPSAPLAVVALGYDEQTLSRPLDGFGFLVPRGQGIRMLGVLWDSSIYPGRAPRGRVLLRAMIGGAHDPDAAALPEDRLLAIVRAELASTMGLTASPVLTAVFRHRLGIPQYTVGHLGRLARIEARLAVHPGLHVAGNSYRGVAINACIADAEPLAGRILAGMGLSNARENQGGPGGSGDSREPNTGDLRYSTV